MAENKKTPKIRFKGFTDDWEQRKVTEVGKTYIGLVTTMTKHYMDEGALLIRNSDIKDGRFEFGSNPIYLKKSFAESNSSRMHQLGDVITVHTGDVGTSAVITQNEENSIGFATIVTRPNPNIIDSNYLSSFLNTDKHKKWAVAISTGDGRTNYNLGDYYKLNVPVSSIKEQKQIAHYIKEVNNLITLHQRKYDKLQNIKKACLEKMFPKNGADVPEIRFKGFTDTWQQSNVGSYYYFKNGINKGKEFFGSGVPIVNFTDVFHNRFIRMSDLNGKVDLQYPEISNYIVKKGDIFFTRTSETIDEIGYSSVMLDDVQNTVFSGFVLRGRAIEEDPLISNFKGYVFFTNQFRKEMIKKSSMTTRALTSGTAIKEMKFKFPQNKIEQTKIGEFFKNLDNLITLQERQLTKLKNIKKSCLEKMFV